MVLLSASRSVVGFTSWLPCVWAESWASLADGVQWFLLAGSSQVQRQDPPSARAPAEGGCSGSLGPWVRMSQRRSPSQHRMDTETQQGINTVILCHRNSEMTYHRYAPPHHPLRKDRLVTSPLILFIIIITIQACPLYIFLF